MIVTPGRKVVVRFSEGNHGPRAVSTLRKAVEAFIVQPASEKSVRTSAPMPKYVVIWADKVGLNPGDCFFRQCERGNP
jgi:hypothetical protein